MTNSAVCGVECNEGWAGLYQPLLDLCQLYGYQVLQVKEKFGGLRFYYAANEQGDKIQQLVAAAEHASYHTCEDCGTSKIIKHEPDGQGGYRPVYLVTTEGPGWIRSLCPDCRTKWNARRVR